jgi:hypothetical protein
MRLRGCISEYPSLVPPIGAVDDSGGGALQIEATAVMDLGDRLREAVSLKAEAT